MFLRSIFFLVSTPPFSSDEDESVEDSAYITSLRGKPSPSVRLVQSGSLMNPTAEPDWTDSELSEASDIHKLHKSPNSHGKQMPMSYMFIYFNSSIWNSSEYRKYLIYINMLTALGHLHHFSKIVCGSEDTFL